MNKRKDVPYFSFRGSREGPPKVGKAESQSCDRQVPDEHANSFESALLRSWKKGATRLLADSEIRMHDEKQICVTNPSILIDPSQRMDAEWFKYGYDYDSTTHRSARCIGNNWSSTFLKTGLTKTNIYDVIPDETSCQPCSDPTARVQASVLEAASSTSSEIVLSNFASVCRST